MPQTGPKRMMAFVSSLCQCCSVEFGYRHPRPYSTIMIGVITHMTKSSEASMNVFRDDPSVVCEVMGVHPLIDIGRD